MAAPDLGPPAAVGSFNWAKGYGAAMGGGGYDSSYNLDVDASGNVLVAGTFNGPSITIGTTTLNGNGDTPFLARFDANGNVLWAKKPVGTLRSLIHDDSGTTYGIINFSGTVAFGSQMLTSAGGTDFAVVKLDTMGNITMAKRFGGQGNDYAWRLALGTDGSVAVTGGFYATTNYGGNNLVSAGGEDIFVVQLDSSWNHVWSKAFGGSSAQDDNPNGMVLDSAGNLIVVGGFGGTVDFGGGGRTSAGLGDGFVVALNKANGQRLWDRTYGSSMDDGVVQIVRGPSDALYLTGYFSGMVDFGAGPVNGGAASSFLLSLDKSGNYRSSKTWSNAYTATLALDAWGEILLGGSFAGTVDLGGGQITSAGNNDGFVLKLSSTGTFLWGKAFGGTGRDGVNGLGTAADGRIFAAGDFATTVTIPTPSPTMLTAVSSQDALVMQLSP